MAELTDPTPAMVSFQQVIAEGALAPVSAALDRDVVALMDGTPNGETRFTCARMDGDRVLAFADFITAGHEQGLPVFQAGVAVPEIKRGKGRAKHILAAGIAEMKHGSGGARPGAAFYIEFVVSLDNVASQHVSAAIWRTAPKPITDSVSGLPALHYLTKIQA